MAMVGRDWFCTPKIVTTLHFFSRMSHFSNNLKADGHGEVWVDMRPETKFKQYGWRCTTKEDSYSNRTLIGNWNQERYDLCKLEERKPLPSQVVMTGGNGNYSWLIPMYIYLCIYFHDQNQSGPYIHEKPGMPQTFLDADDLRASYAGFLHLDVVPSSTMQKTSTSHYTVQLLVITTATLQITAYLLLPAPMY